MARQFSIKRSPADKLLRNLAEREARKRKKSEPAFADDAEMKARVTLTQGEMDAWNQIAAGRPMRNSTAVLQAIKMKMEYTVQKPAQKVDADTRLTVEVVNLGTPQEPPAPAYQPGKIEDDIVKQSPRPERDDEP
jgi:hypothetical protein